MSGLLLARIAAAHRGGITPVLDRLTAAPSAAYALRKLRAAYTGAAVSVRRSSDNTAQDIGFAGSDLDTVALLAFCGAGDGFVAKWYDQTGNGRDAATATTTLQPSIVLAGAVRTKNGKPTIYWNANQLTATINTFSAGFAVNAVAGVSVNNSFNCIASKVTGNIANPIDFWSNATEGHAFVGNGSASPNTSLTPVLFNAATAFGVWTYQATTTSGATAFYNGASDIGGSTGTSYGDSTSPVTIGKRGDGATTLNGWISELVLMPAPLTTTDRHTLERDQGTYFAVTVS